MTEVRWLTEREERAWRGYMRMRPLLDLRIGRDLRKLGLSGADYEVLVILSEAPDGELRLIDMATQMLWSKSRLAHHLDRMQSRDLVDKHPHPAGSRAVCVVLTEQGRERIAEAAVHHVTSVRRHFIDLLTPDQLDALGEATAVVVDHLREDVPPPRPEVQRAQRNR